MRTPRSTTTRLCLPGVLLVCLSLPGCIRTEEELPDTGRPKTAQEASANMGNPLLPNKGDFNSVNVNVSTSEELEKFDNGSNEELIWTDPDNPNAEIPELTAAFQNKRMGTGWQENLSRAISLSRRQELPLVIWFHDSLLSRKCKALAADLMNTKEFDAWSRSRVIRLRLDSGAAVGDSTADSAPYSAEKINSIRRFYGLKHKPSVVVISANGKITGKLDGYNGNVEKYAQDLGRAVTDAEKSYKTHKDELRTRGYREWHGQHSSKVIFAKLMRVDDTRRMVYLKQDGGRITHTRMDNLSQEDIDYLEERRRASNAARRSEEREDNEQI